MTKHPSISTRGILLSLPQIAGRHQWHVPIRRLFMNFMSLIVSRMSRPARRLLDEQTAAFKVKICSVEAHLLRLANLARLRDAEFRRNETTPRSCIEAHQ